MLFFISNTLYISVLINEKRVIKRMVLLPVDESTNNRQLGDIALLCMYSSLVKSKEN